MAFRREDILDDILGFQPTWEQVVQYSYETVLFNGRKRHAHWRLQPGNAERVRQYMKAYNQRPEVKERQRARNRARQAQRNAWKRTARQEERSRRRDKHLDARRLGKPKAKITMKIARQIRQTKANKPWLTYKAVGKLFNLGVTATWMVVKGKSWI